MLTTANLAGKAAVSSPHMTPDLSAAAAGSKRDRWAQVLALVSAFVFTTACNLQFSTGIEAKSGWSRTYKVTSGATLEIREPNGRIRVEATDGNEVEVTATRVAKAPTEDAAKAAAEKIQINEKVSDNRIELDSTSGFQMTAGYSQRVDYDVKVPRSTNLVIKATNSAVDIQSVAGMVKVEAVNGEIQISGADKGADVVTVNGRVIVNLAQVGTEGVRVKTTNGAIEIGVPPTAKATFAARVSNGAVEVENLDVQASEKSHRRLDATLGGGGPEIRLDTTNGLIKIVGR